MTRDTDTLTALRQAAEWLVKVHGDDVTLKGTALAEDIDALRAALEATIPAVSHEASTTAAQANSGGRDDTLTALREAVLGVPLGTYPKPGLASVAGWNRYDTDDEHVLHLFESHETGRGQSWDIRAPKVATVLATPPTAANGQITEIGPDGTVLPSKDTVPLDVDRLRVAMNDAEIGLRHYDHDDAATVAREYARLATPPTADEEERRVIYRCGVHGQERCGSPAPMYETMTAEDVARVAVHAGWPPPGPPDPPTPTQRMYGG